MPFILILSLAIDIIGVSVDDIRFDVFHRHESFVDANPCTVFCHNTAFLHVTRVGSEKLWGAHP